MEPQNNLIEPTNKSHRILFTVIIILLTALVVGGSVYYVMSKNDILKGGCGKSGSSVLAACISNAEVERMEKEEAKKKTEEKKTISTKDNSYINDTYGFSVTIPENLTEWTPKTTGLSKDSWLRFQDSSKYISLNAADIYTQTEGDYTTSGVAFEVKVEKENNYPGFPGSTIEINGQNFTDVDLSSSKNSNLNKVLYVKKNGYAFILNFYTTTEKLKTQFSNDFDNFAKSFKFIN